MIRFCGIFVVGLLLNEKKTLFRIPLKLHLNVKHGEHLVNTESVIKSTKQQNKNSYQRTTAKCGKAHKRNLKREIK